MIKGHLNEWECHTWNGTEPQQWAAVRPLRWNKETQVRASDTPKMNMNQRSRRHWESLNIKMPLQWVAVRHLKWCSFTPVSGSVITPAKMQGNTTSLNWNTSKNAEPPQRVSVCHLQQSITIVVSLVVCLENTKPLYVEKVGSLWWQKNTPVSNNRTPGKTKNLPLEQSLDWNSKNPLKREAVGTSNDVKPLYERQ